MDDGQTGTFEPAAPPLTAGTGVALPNHEPEPEPETETETEPAAAPPLAPTNTGMVRNSSWVQDRPADTVALQTAALETRPEEGPDMAHGRALEVLQNAMRKALARRTATGLRCIRDLGLALSVSQREAKRISIWEEM
eukprot:COSAG02_NODE_468_length_21758_cov_41.206796_15_plen_138_part_00